MKEILINYPIKILKQELINIRTGYRLEKKKIIEILKTMKSINKLTKEELIDLLIKYNYDISKLPKLEDLIKPKKERKPRTIKQPKAKELEISTGKSQIKTREELERRKFYKIPSNIDDAIKKIQSDNINYPNQEDKNNVIEMFKYLYKILDNYKDIKKELLDNYDKLDKKLSIEEYEKKIKQLFYNNIKGTILNPGASYRDLKEVYLANERTNLKTSILKNIYDSLKFRADFEEKLPDIYIKKFLNVLKKYLEDKLEISTGKSQIKTREELELRRDELLKKKRETENKQFENLNNFVIVKNPSVSELIKMKDDFKKDEYKWSLEALQKGLTIERILEIADMKELDYKLLNAFFTPDEIIENMLVSSFFYENYNYNKNTNKQTIHILEPTGGVGNIIYYLLESLKEEPKYIKIDFVEINRTFIEIAKARLFKYRHLITFHNISFFDFKPNIEYDYIFGNPPYNIKIKNKQVYDVDFLIKSYEYLAEGSRISFLISTSSMTGRSESHKKFKKLLLDITDTDDIKQLINNNYAFEIQEKFTKKEKGIKAGLTSISTYLFVLQKPYIYED